MENKEINKIVVPIKNPYSNLKLSDNVTLVRDGKETLLSIAAEGDVFSFPVVGIVGDRGQGKMLQRYADGHYICFSSQHDSKHFDPSAPSFIRGEALAVASAKKHEALLSNGVLDPYFKMEEYQDRIERNAVIGTFHLDGIEEEVLLKIVGIPNVVQAWRNSDGVTAGPYYCSYVMTCERLADTPWELTKAEVSNLQYYGDRNQPLKPFDERVHEGWKEKEVLTILTALYEDIKYRQNKILDTMQLQKRLLPSVKNIETTVGATFTSIDEVNEIESVRGAVGGRSYSKKTKALVI